MERRTFLQVPAAGAAAATTGATGVTPRYRVVTRYRPAIGMGMPGPWPGRVVRARSARSIDEKTDRVDPAVVREMLGARDLPRSPASRTRRAPGAASSRPTTW